MVNCGLLTVKKYHNEGGYKSPNLLTLEVYEGIVSSHSHINLKLF